MGKIFKGGAKVAKVTTHINARITAKVTAKKTGAVAPRPVASVAPRPGASVAPRPVDPKTGRLVERAAPKAFDIQRSNCSKIMMHQNRRFGKFYQDKNTKLWYTKDTAKHGGSHWKVYRQNGNNLLWEKDLSKFGERIPKHKSEVGKVIRMRDLRGVSY